MCVQLFSVDPEFDSTYKSNMIVYSDGTVNWVPPGIFNLACQLDITWFPFDEQLCYFKVSLPLLNFIIIPKLKRHTKNITKIINE